MAIQGTKRRKVVLFALLSVLVFVAVVGVMALRDAFAVRRQATVVLGQLTTIEHHPEVLLTHDGRVATERALERAANGATSAATAIDGSVGLSFFGHLPYLGRSTHGAADLARDAATTAVVLQKVVEELDHVAQPSSGHVVNWSALKEFATTADQSSSTLRELIGHGKGLWGPVGAKREEFRQAASNLADRLHAVGSGAELASSLFGVDQPSRILVLAANNAEMRAEGAFLSYALIDFHDGAIAKMRTGSLAELERGIAVENAPPAAAMLVNNGATRLWSAINMPANFAWSGQVAASKLKATIGITPDYVLGVDVVTLRELLGAVGPVTVSNFPGQLSSSNVASVLLRSLYERYGSTHRTERLEVLSEVIAAAVRKATVQPAHLSEVAKACGHAIAGRHLLLWSANPQRQQVIRELHASGELDQRDPRRTFSVAVESAVAAKMDAFDVATSLSYRVVVQPDRRTLVDLAVTVTNLSPRNLRPGSYIYGPDGWNAHQPGEYVANVFVWTPTDGAPRGAVADSGLALRATSVALLPGESKVVHFYTTLAAPRDGEAAKLLFIPQPRLTPMKTTVDVVDGDTTKHSEFPLEVTREVIVETSPR